MGAFKRQRRIEQEIIEEFGAPVRETLQGFARDGHSLQFTARCLGIAYDTLQRLAARHGVIFCFGTRPPMAEEAKARIRAAKLAQARQDNRLFTRGGVTKHLSAWARELGVHLSTIVRRIEVYGWPPAMALSRGVERARTKGGRMPSRIDRDALADIYQSGASIPEIADMAGIHPSTARYHLAKSGVLRTRAEGVRLAAAKGKLGSGMRGKRRAFSAEHRQKISAAKKRLGELFAKGTTTKPSGYIEITRGPLKGKMEHRVVAERLLGRPLAAGEEVHHVDRNKGNNHPSNLRVLSRSDHARLHALDNYRTRERDKNGRFI